MKFKFFIVACIFLYQFLPTKSEEKLVELINNTHNSVIKKTTSNTEITYFLYDLSPFPVPASNNVSIKIYWDPALAMIKENISIYNISGIKQPVSENITIDFVDTYWGYIKWDCSTFESGIYIVVINHGTTQESTKVLITR